MWSPIHASSSDLTAYIESLKNIGYEELVSQLQLHPDGGAVVPQSVQLDIGPLYQRAQTLQQAFAEIDEKLSDLRQNNRYAALLEAPTYHFLANPEPSLCTNDDNMEALSFFQCWNRTRDVFSRQCLSIILLPNVDQLEGVSSLYDDYPFDLRSWIENASVTVTVFFPGI